MTHDKIVRQLETELFEVKMELAEKNKKIYQLNEWVIKQAHISKSVNERMAYVEVRERVQNDFAI